MTPAKIASFIVLATSIAACKGRHGAKQYEAEVILDRITVVTKDDNGKPRATDVEFTYASCPGDEEESIRSGPDFSSCVMRYAPGTRVKAKIDRAWDSEKDHYVWHVVELGDCKRTIDPKDDASFAVIRDCSPYEVSGVQVGVECRLAPSKELVAACPWFARH